MKRAQELDLKRKVALGRSLPPIYDRAGLALTAADHAAHDAAGERPHWRFALDHAEPIAWHDAIRGDQQFDPRQISDPVIRRADGSWAVHAAVGDRRYRHGHYPGRAR